MTWPITSGSRFKGSRSELNKARDEKNGSWIKWMLRQRIRDEGQHRCEYRQTHRHRINSVPNGQKKLDRANLFLPNLLNSVQETGFPAKVLDKSHGL